MIIHKLKKIKTYNIDEIQQLSNFDSDTLIATNIEDFDRFFINPDFLKKLEEYNNFINNYQLNITKN